MKALSLCVPWTFAVLYCEKRIANRVWSTNFRGTFLIHASQGYAYPIPRSQVAPHPSKRERYETCAAEIHRISGRDVPSYDQIERGGIVGVARVVAVRPPLLNVGPWAMKGQHGFVLADVAPLSFIPCNGALQFWDASGLTKMLPLDEQTLIAERVRKDVDAKF